jgi:polysaccharide biosynthesis/export protein
MSNCNVMATDQNDNRWNQFAVLVCLRWNASASSSTACNPRAGVSPGHAALVRKVLRSALCSPWLAFVLWLPLCCGCGGGRLYHATNLPVEFLAPQTDNAQTVDLSRLATFSVSSELIDRGDVLEVTIETGYGVERGNTTPVRVADDGTAHVPLVGKVPVAGLELEAAEQAISSVAVQRGVFRSPSVTVVMKRQRSNKVTVLGAVESPGVYELPRASSYLLAAIVEAEGLSKDAGTDVEIRRPARTIIMAAAEPAPSNFGGPAPQPQTTTRPATSTRINLVEAAEQGNGGLYLEDGDVVMVEKRDPQPIHVIGLVNKAGQFELPTNQDLHLLDVVALAGGTSSQVADKIHVIRRVPGQPEPVVIEVSLGEAKRQGKGNLRMAPGDVVSVEQTPATVVLGALNNFVRFGLSGTIPLF